MGVCAFGGAEPSLLRGADCTAVMLPGLVSLCDFDRLLPVRLRAGRAVVCTARASACRLGV